MKRYKLPDQIEIEEIIRRPELPLDQSDSVVRTIIDEVRAGGDTALRSFTKKFDGADLESLWVSDREIAAARDLVAPKLKESIALAQRNIELFHLAQREVVRKIETMPGVSCWRRSVAISPVGFYVPGGTAALFSTALMMAVPANIAGCEEIIACTPPTPEGTVNPVILYVLSELGVRRIAKVGGAHAIAALAFGTETIPKVEKIFGPGNRFVTSAKQLVSRLGVAIDIPAGPSELAIIADSSANAEFIAADLLSQAEHGGDSQVLLITTSAQLIDRVAGAVSEQLKTLPRREVAEKALGESRLVEVATLVDGFSLINRYAPEHLIIMTKDAEFDAEQVTNAGSVFLGDFSPEAVGDYASGTNHILPTNGYASKYSGVSLDSFYKKITFQQLSKEGLGGIASAVECMAKAEGLEAHARAVSIRMRCR